MDGLAGLLDGPRAHGAFLLRCLMDAPWGIRLEDEAPLTVAAVVRGHAWVLRDGSDPVRLDEGDVVIWADSAHWVLVDDPSTVPQIVVHPDQSCTTLDGRSLVQDMHQGVRSWGNSSVGETVLLTGVYLVEGEVGRRLVGSLPQMIVVAGEDIRTPVIGLLADEVVRDTPGQDAVLDRLLDLLLIMLLRHWFDRSGTAVPGWYAGQSDPVIGTAVRLVQHHPDHPWTVRELADRCGLSRAAFARRFAAVVGQPPMAFLTQWRITLAADLLLDRDTTIATVARQVGYSTPFALSAAFKRERGVSPRDHRAARTA